jgi:hypothetical protein
VEFAIKRPAGNCAAAWASGGEEQDGEVRFDPDESVLHTMRTVFAKFTELGYVALPLPMMFDLFSDPREDYNQWNSIMTTGCMGQYRRSLQPMKRVFTTMQTSREVTAFGR